MALRLSRAVGGYAVRCAHDGDPPVLRRPHAAFALRDHRAHRTGDRRAGSRRAYRGAGKFPPHVRGQRAGRVSVCQDIDMPRCRDAAARADIRCPPRRHRAVRLGGQIDQVLVEGTRIMREVAMFHRASRTLILVDLIENFTDATPHTGGALKFWFRYVLRMWNNPRPAPEYRMGWSDRAAAAQSLRRILAWDFERIVIAHGDLIEHDAHAVAARAWAKVLGR